MALFSAFFFPVLFRADSVLPRTLDRNVSNETSFLQQFLPHPQAWSIRASNSGGLPPILIESEGMARFEQGITAHDSLLSIEETAMNLENIDFSNPVTIAIVAVVALAIILTIAVVIHNSRTKARLRRSFGTEYDRAILEHGSERKAQAALAEREARVHKLTLRELGPVQRERFLADWNTVQSRFVDFPKGALVEADERVTSLLRARGYPASGFEQGVEDVSVAYPRLVENYRSAHNVAVLSAKGEATTEDMRNAMIQYRALFDELVKVDTSTEFRTAQNSALPTQSLR
jgi:hypothetical protein